MVAPVPDVDVNYLSNQGCLVVIVVAESHNHRFPGTIQNEFVKNVFSPRDFHTLSGPRVFLLASCSSAEIFLRLYKVQPGILNSLVPQTSIIFQTSPFT